MLGRSENPGVPVLFGLDRVNLSAKFRGANGTPGTPSDDISVFQVPNKGGEEILDLSLREETADRKEQFSKKNKHARLLGT